MYRTIESNFWNDPKVIKLSTHGKLLFLYLITNPHTHASGLYPLRIEIAALETGIHDLQVHLSELVENGIVEHDPDCNMIFVIKMFHHQVRNPSCLKNVAKHLGALHKTPLIHRLIARYSQDLQQFLSPETLKKALQEGGEQLGGSLSGDSSSPGSAPSTSAFPVSGSDSPEKGGSGGETTKDSANVLDDLCEDLYLIAGQAFGGKHRIALAKLLETYTGTELKEAYREYTDSCDDFQMKQAPKNFVEDVAKDVVRAIRKRKHDALMLGYQSAKKEMQERDGHAEDTILAESIDRTATYSLINLSTGKRWALQDSIRLQEALYNVAEIPWGIVLWLRSLGRLLENHTTEEIVSAYKQFVSGIDFTGLDLDDRERIPERFVEVTTDLLAPEKAVESVATTEG